MLQLNSHAYAFDFSLDPIVYGAHDTIWIDHRGQGRDAGYQRCDLAMHTAEVNSIQINDIVGQLLHDCVQQTLTAEVPLSTVQNQDVSANDFNLVRQALGIDRWSIYAQTFGLDIALRMVKAEPDSVTSIMSIDPGVAGSGWSTANADAAFAHFSADSAAIPSCAVNGDLGQHLDAAAARLRPGVTTKTPNGAGGYVKFDEPALLNGVLVAMNDAALAPLLPGLLVGLVDGSADDVVAGFYASRAVASDPVAFADDCPTLSYIRPPVATFGNVGPGRFGAVSWKPECDAIGPVPANTDVLPVSADIPVLVVVKAYSAWASMDSAQAIFAGFPNATIVEAPGVSQLTVELGDCLAATATAFFDDATAKNDLSCITNPAKRTLQP